MSKFQTMKRRWNVGCGYIYPVTIFGLQFKTMVTVVSYFGNVTAPLFVLEIYALMIQNKKMEMVLGSHKGY